MAASNVDLLVRIGVLEKLVDKLMDKVDRLETKINSHESRVTQPVEDEWAINNETGSVEKKDAVLPDDLTMLQS